MNDLPFFQDIGPIAIRLLISIFCAGLIGWDRERLRKPAGLRTHILVGIGACLMTLISLLMSRVENGTVIFDSRIAANVVVGIGFLGAGTILHPREGVVSGLTTAASLWVVAGIGIAVGCGFYAGAFLTTVLVLLTLYLMNRLDDHIEGTLYHSVTIHARMTPHLTEDAKELLRTIGIRIVRTMTVNEAPEGKTVTIHIHPVPLAKGKQAARRIEKLRGVREVELN
ncbi:MAG TPA: MgtC/SapB family protein [bacterium]|nr:MgtC/SapB family protein [bacterium]